MGGKKGERQDAKAERDAAKAAEKSTKERQAKEDADWAAAGDGQKSKAAAKRDEVRR